MVFMQGGDGVVPAAFETVQQAGPDLGGDVGVDVADLVGNPVPSRRDCALSGMPSAMIRAVAEVVEAKSGQDRCTNASGRTAA